MSLSDKEREEIINKALETPEGRQAFAKVVIDSIKYCGLDEKVLDVEDIEKEPDNPIDSRFDILDI